MARTEQDREDLMGAATVLVRRVELQLPDIEDQCIIGFRRGGAASIFIGADPVFQFNVAGAMRRGFWNGRPVKAEHGRLVQLERRRTDSESQLIRHKFSDAATTEFLQLAAATLNLLRQVLHADELVILKQVPNDLDVVQELTNWLDSLTQPIAIAAAPNVEP